MTDGELERADALARAWARCEPVDLQALAGAVGPLVAEVRRLRAARFAHEWGVDGYRRRVEAPTVEGLKAASAALYPPVFISTPDTAVSAETAELVEQLKTSMKASRSSRLVILPDTPPEVRVAWTRVEPTPEMVADAGIPADWLEKTVRAEITGFADPAPPPGLTEPRAGPCPKCGAAGKDVLSCPHGKPPPADSAPPDADAPTVVE